MATSEREQHIRDIAQMRSEYRKKVAKFKKKRFMRMMTNLIVSIIFLTSVGVGMSSIGYTRAYLFIIMGLLPGILATITDKRPGRFASKTVIAFNITGMSPHLASIFYSGSPNQTAMAIMQEFETWILIYGFAGFGWAIIFIIPYIAELYLEVKAAYTVKKLTQFRKALVDEWGDEIKK